MRPRWFLCLCAFLLAVMPSLAFASPSAIDFTATWCGPCKTMQPTIETLKREGYAIRQVDVDGNPDVAKQYNVTQIPCVVFVDSGGGEITRVVGVASVDKLRDLFARHSAKGRTPSKWQYIPRPTKHRASVLRILTHDGKENGYGSGTLIHVGTQELVLTARHVIAGAKQVTLRDATGQECPALVLGTDPVWDCALLQPVGALAADASYVAEGDDAKIDSDREYETCGWGPPNTQLACSYPNRFVAWVDHQQNTGITDWMALAGSSRPGDSGGPVFNSNGQLVGIIWGGPKRGTGEIMCVQPGRVHAFLSGYWQWKTKHERPAQPQSAENAPRDGIAASLHQYGRPMQGPAVSVRVAGNPTPSKSRLPWRAEVSGKLDSIDNKMDNLPPPLPIPLPSQQLPPSTTTAPPSPPVDMVPVIHDQIGKTVPPMIDAAVKPMAQDLEAVKTAVAPIGEFKKRLDAAEERGGLIGKAAQKIEDKVFGEASDRPEKKKGVFSRLTQIGDDSELLWFALAVIALVVIWKRGGIHRIVESHRDQLEDRASAGGLRGRLAGRVLQVHDGPIGTAVGKVESRLQPKQAADVVSDVPSEVAPEEVTQ